MEKMITTADNFEGYRITEYYGIVSAVVLMSAARRGDIREYRAAYRVEACDKLMERLPEGANAVVCVRGETVKSSVDEYAVVGTAVHIEKCG